MEQEVTCVEATTNNKVNRLPSPKEILQRYLSKLLIKYTKWEGLLKKSETFFISDLDQNDHHVDRKKKRPKLDGDHLNNSTCEEESKALACLDWRTHNGALTQDEKANLNRNLRIIMKNINGIDLMLTQFITEKKVNDDDDVIT